MPIPIIPMVYQITIGMVARFPNANIAVMAVIAMAIVIMQKATNVLAVCMDI